MSFVPQLNVWRLKRSLFSGNTEALCEAVMCVSTRVTIALGQKNRDLSERRACGYNAQADKTQIPSAIGDLRGDCSQSWGCRGKNPDEIQIREGACSDFLNSPTKSAHLRPVGVGREVDRTDLRLVGIPERLLLEKFTHRQIGINALDRLGKNIRYGHYFYLVDMFFRRKFDSIQHYHLG